MLLERLPNDSVTVREVGGESFEWRHQEHLLATIADLIAQSNYLFVSAHSSKKPTAPTPLTRPGQRKPVDGRRRGTRKFTPAELERVLEKAREVNVDDVIS